MRKIAVATVVTVVALLLALPLAVLAQGLPTAPPEQVGLSSARLARIGEMLRADVEKGRIPGAVVARRARGKVAYFESGRLPRQGGERADDAGFASSGSTR